MRFSTASSVVVCCHAAAVLNASYAFVISKRCEKTLFVHDQAGERPLDRTLAIMVAAELPPEEQPLGSLCTFSPS